MDGTHEWNITDKAVITRVQTRLKELGVYTGPVDGTYHEALLVALTEFQAARGLPTTGALDPATTDALGIRWTDVVGGQGEPGT